MSWFHRVRAPVACLLLAVVLPACVVRSWQSVPADQVIAQETLPPRLRITTSDGAQVELEAAVQQHDSIAGYVVAIHGWGAAPPPVGTQTTIAKGDIAVFELRRVSGGRTFLATVFISIAAIYGTVGFFWLATLPRPIKL